MMYVRVLVEDQWREVPVRIERPPEPDPQAPEPSKLARTLIMAREVGRWKVNDPERGVEVFPGLVVSFNHVSDADFLLGFGNNRASRVHVMPGDIVTFHNDADARYFIEQGFAELASEAEAKQLADEATKPRAGNVHPIATPAKAGKRAGGGR
jgi:hypothetical protein